MQIYYNYLMAVKKYLRKRDLPNINTNQQNINQSMPP
jgi:hypothetical protein